MGVINKIVISLFTITLLSACVPAVEAPPVSAPEEEKISPYVMVMLDYGTGSSGFMCSSLSDCASKMSSAAFVELCQQSAGGDEVNCAIYYSDIADDGVANNSQGAANYSGINTVAKRFEFEVFVAILTAVLNDASGFHIGLVVPNSDYGGTVLQGFGLIESDDDVFRDQFISKLLAIPRLVSGAYAHKFQVKETLYELYRYINGESYINLKNTSGNFTASGSPRAEGFTDYDGCVIDGVSCDALTGVITGGVDAGSYGSPFFGDETCVRFYNLIMAFSGPNMDNDLNSEITADMSAFAASGVDEMLAYLSNDATDLVAGLEGVQNMKSWIISDPIVVATVNDWAVAGGTGSEPLLLDDLVLFESQLRDIFTNTANGTCN